MAESRVTEYQYVVRLPGDLREALHALAQAEDRPIARIIRSALRHYLQNVGQVRQLPPDTPIYDLTGE